MIDCDNVADPAKALLEGRKNTKTATKFADDLAANLQV